MKPSLGKTTQLRRGLQETTRIRHDGLIVNLIVIFKNKRYADYLRSFEVTLAGSGGTGWKKIKFHLVCMRILFCSW